jgi:hypothetical protein
MRPIVLCLVVSLLAGCNREQGKNDRAENFPQTSRKVASFSLPFTLGTGFQCVLYMVHSGKIERLCTRTMVESPNVYYLDGTKNEPHMMTVDLLITEESPRKGKTHYSLSDEGSHRSFTSDNGKTYAAVQRMEKKLLVEGDLTNSIPESQLVLLYAEGDQTPKAQQGMTPESFAQQNRGDFLIITLRWCNDKDKL